MKTQQIEFSGMELDDADKPKGTRKIHGSVALLSLQGRRAVISFRIEDAAIELDLGDLQESLSRLGYD